MSPRLRRGLELAGYAAFYLFALLVFAYVTFPYERLRDRIVQEFNQRQTGPDALRLELDELDSYWLSGVEAEGIRLISPPKPSTAAPEAGAVVQTPTAMSIDSAHARVGMFGLLFGNINLTFGADAFGGSISGRTSESDGAREVELDLDELSLAEAPLLGSAVGLPVAGTVSGRLEFVLPEGKLAKGDGVISLKGTDLSVGDGKAKIRETIALPKIEAGELTIEGQATAGQLKIETLSAKGPDLELESEGSVRLRDPMPTSVLNLTARFRFTERYTGKNEMTRALFGTPGSSMPGLFDLDPKNKRAKRGDGFYGWRASGALSQPTFTPYAAGVAAPAKAPR